MENTAAQATNAQSNGAAEEIEKKKRTLLDLIREIIELFRKPYYGAAMKALEDNLNTMGYNNAATAAVLDNLISVTGEIKGKLTGDMSEEKAQELMRELQDKIAAVSSEIANVQNIVDVLASDGVNGETFNLYRKGDNLYIAKTENGLIGEQAYMIDVATSPEGVKKAFTYRVIDVDPMESVTFQKVALNESDKSHSEAILDVIIHEFLSDEELAQQTANRKLISDLKNDIDRVVTQSSESLFYEKDDGRFCSYINKDGNFCVADRQQEIMFVFVQDENTNALRAECYKCNSSLQAEGERLFIAGEWTNHNDTIHFQRTENEALNLSGLYTFEATTHFLKNHNISDEHIAALRNDIVTPNTNTDLLTKKGENRIKSIYLALANSPEVKSEGLNVELHTVAGNYLRFTSKSGNVTQVNYDKNGNAVSVEYRASNEQEFKTIQQTSNGMTNILAKPPQDCATIMDILKKSQYSLAAKRGNNAISQTPKDKITLDEVSSPELWARAESDDIRERISVAIDKQTGEDILKFLANDDNLYVRQAVARFIKDEESIARLATDTNDYVRVELAKRGLQSDILVSDKSAVVRAALAKSGSCLEKLVDDPDYSVRAAIAEQGYGLDKLINDPIEIVRNAARTGLGEVTQEQFDKMFSSYPAERAEVAYECRNNPRVMSILANDLQKRVRLVVAENGGALDKLINDREGDVRLAVAKQGYGLDKLMNDVYTPIRIEIVKQGYELQKFVADPAPEVRIAVAQQRVGLNELACDKDVDVRVAVAQNANRREHSDVLRTLLNDSSPAVRIALAERNYGLDTLLHDKDETVRAAVAKQNVVYAEMLMQDKSETVRNAARATVKPVTTQERE